MGNYFSCSSISSNMKSSKAARVVFPGGETRQFREPVKAAEIMLECPTFFLVNSKSLNMGRRFSALSADEDLEFGNVYVLFPMKRVNSVITAADMAMLWMAANSAPKRISGGKVRILPESEEGTRTAMATGVESGNGLKDGDIGRPRLNLEEVEGLTSPEFKFRVSVCRSRKPMLDTITEEPICLR